MSRRYLSIVAIGVALMLAGVATVCALVDPYGLVGAPAILGLNARKLAAADRQRMVKPNLVELRQPVTLVMGSSIANLGLDPDDPEWQPAHRPVFNFGIDGASPDVQLHLLRHALVSAHPGRIVLVLSFEDVLMPAPRYTATQTAMFEFRSRMRVQADGRPNPRFWLTHAQDLATALLTGQALRASLDTLVHQHDAMASHLSLGGLDSGGRLDREIAAHGQDGLIAGWLAELTQRLLRWQRAPDWPLGPVGAMVAVARQAGAEPVIVIAPVRTEQLELRRQFGIEPEVRHWRHALADLAATAAVPLWDFGGVTPYGDEPGQRPARWFYDSSHFRPALGALVAARIEGGPGPFGVLLSPATVDAETTGIETDLSAWEQADPGRRARVAAAVAEGRRLACKREPAACTVAVAR